MDAKPLAEAQEHLFVKTSDVVNSNLWRLFPVINVDKVKDIPRDYPGAMGVPITIVDKLNREQFELIGCIAPKIGNREVYKRLVIRHLHPDLPEYIDMTEWLEKTGSKYEAVVVSEP